jgi:hypothetical protein
MSIGLAELPRYDEGTTVDDLMALADERMYQDKRRRRGSERLMAGVDGPI